MLSVTYVARILTLPESKSGINLTAYLGKVIFDDDCGTVKTSSMPFNVNIAYNHGLYNFLEHIPNYKN